MYLFIYSFVLYCIFDSIDSQVQGILKSMYDAFAADLEKANAEESVEQGAFVELMATKKAELKTLRATLEHHEVNKASPPNLLTF